MGTSQRTVFGFAYSYFLIVWLPRETDLQSSVCWQRSVLLKHLSAGNRFLIASNDGLPVLCEVLKSYHTAMSKEKEKSPAIPIRVLLVDNEKDHASAMTESLERIGLECSFATSGPEGIQMLSKDTYDIVVTDLMMNDVDGMGILKHTKDRQPHCEVILVTGHATVHARWRPCGKARSNS